jgi:spermidine synthase
MVWFHLVQLVVGSSAISVAVLLCSFMGGMALGSWLIPRLVSSAAPLPVIAVLEGGIAAFGILIPSALPLVQQAYVAMVGDGFGAVLLRAAVCALVLTPPTMLMGATLPVIARVRDADVGRLYTMNLAGGAIGTAIAGFYLLRVFDVYIASGVAIVINVAIAVAAWRLSGRDIASDYERRRTSTRVGSSLLAAAALSGFTALGAEVIWTRQLSLLFGASVYTFSLILAVFLSGLAIGGAAGARIARRSAEPAAVLGRMQLALAIAIAAGAWLVVNALPW